VKFASTLKLLVVVMGYENKPTLPVVSQLSIVEILFQMCISLHVNAPNRYLDFLQSN